MRAKVPDIHAVIDRALSASGQAPEDGAEGRRGSCASDAMTRSRNAMPRGSRRGSTLGVRRGSTLSMRAQAEAVKAVTVVDQASPRATEVNADLCLGDFNGKAA